MFGFLILIVVIAIFVYSFKQAADYSPPGPQFNTVVIFQNGFYVDIRSYELFRNIAKWERSGLLSFKGSITIPKADLVQVIHTELELPKDKFKVTFFQNSTTTFDYIVTFTTIPKPILEDLPLLEILGIWESYGKNSYRIATSISEEKFKELIAKELHIPADSFTVHNATSYAWSRLL